MDFQLTATLSLVEEAVLLNYLIAHGTLSLEIKRVFVTVASEGVLKSWDY